MKEEGKSDEKLYENEPIIWVGNRENAIYIEERTCVSQLMIGTNEDGLMALHLENNPCLDPVTAPTHYRLGGLKQTRY